MGPTDIHIRNFQSGDESAVAELWRAVFGYKTAHNDPSLVIAAKMAVQRDLFHLALVDDTLAGTVMSGYDGHRGWIYTLAVAEAFRRRGVGTTLLQHAETALIERGSLKINLQVMPENDGAVAFYEALGYCVEPRISMGKIIHASHAP